MAFTTLPSAGSKLRASVLNSLITEVRPVSAVKTADTSRASTIARVADPDLSLALPVNSTWIYKLVILILSAANAAGDFSGEMAYPTNAVHMFGAHGLDPALPSGSLADLRSDAGTRDTVSPSSSFEFGVSTTVTSITVLGRVEIGSTPGNLVLNWAQQASNINATIVQDGSTLTAWRLS